MCKCQQIYSPGFDFSLFKNTSVDKLAKAVEEQDTLKIESLIKKGNLNTDYQEPKFGYSLLTLALHNNKEYSAKKLLDLKANPNIKSPRDNSTPFLIACRFALHIENIGYILSLLIEKGADVNSEQVEELQNSAGEKIKHKKTALQYLCDFGNVSCIKLLVEKGAKLNIYPVNGEGSIITEATLNPRLDILRYLLIDKRVPIPDYCVVREEGTPHERKISLRNLINERKELQDADQQQVEQEILKFLDANGK